MLSTRFLLMFHPTVTLTLTSLLMTSISKNCKNGASTLCASVSCGKVLSVNQEFTTIPTSMRFLTLSTDWAMLVFTLSSMLIKMYWLDTCAVRVFPTSTLRKLLEMTQFASAALLTHGSNLLSRKLVSANLFTIPMTTITLWMRMMILLSLIAKRLFSLTTMYQLSLLMFSMLSTRTSLDFRINLLLHGPVLLSNSLTTPTLLDSIPSTNLSLEITLLILLLTSQESSIELHLHLCTRESSQLGRLRTPNPSCTSKVLNSQIFLAISVVKFSILDSKLPQVVKLVQTSTFSMITLTAARRAPQSALLVNLFLKMLPNVSPGIRRESTLVFKMLKDSESLLS
mmetsp:Transcript_24214/g.17040  ORF Transcript_24214/g.17040 Transcript_24214/m.17040 type:complete len:341 (+) Transcript_24214:159-1181(+)